MKEEDPVRFGAEFGPKRTENSTGVSLSTFKTLVWVSNLGGLLLCVIGLELMMVQQEFWMALFCIVAGVAIALFPSNYEIVGMGGIEIEQGESSLENIDENKRYFQSLTSSTKSIREPFLIPLILSVKCIAWKILIPIAISG